MSIIENRIQYFFSKLPLFFFYCGYILGKIISCRTSRFDKSQPRETKRFYCDWNNERSNIWQKGRWGSPTVGKEWWEETSHNRRDKCRSFSCGRVVWRVSLKAKKRCRVCSKGRGRAQRLETRTWLWTKNNDGRSPSIFVAKRAIARSHDETRFLGCLLRIFLRPTTGFCVLLKRENALRIRVFLSRESPRTGTLSLLPITRVYARTNFKFL